jgi:hypothetical protein
VTTPGDGNLEIGPAGSLSGTAPIVRSVGGVTVYDQVLEALTSGGWVQGRNVHRTRRSLTAAIDEVVGSVEGPGPKAAALARSARVRNHLCELAGTTNLVAWNDARERGFDDLATLLSMAAVAFPQD